MFVLLLRVLSVALLLRVVTLSVMLLLLLLRLVLVVLLVVVACCLLLYCLPPCCRCEFFAFPPLPSFLVPTRHTWSQYMQASKRARTPALSLWSFKSAQVTTQF